MLAGLSDIAGLNQHADAPRYPRSVSLIEARVAAGSERADLLAELDDVLRWLAARATDLLAILSASQALSSETSVERLHARVTEGPRP